MKISPASTYKFNYIITVHNKESLIRAVLMSVINCAGEHSCIYPVLDGCTDGSEQIIDDIIQANPEFKIVKLYADDVHELKSINVALNYSDQQGAGFNIVLQDDVLLQDPNLEMKCIFLYQSFPKLGLLSFRHGGNISRTAGNYSSVADILEDYVQSEFGHYPKPKSMLTKDSFIFKEVIMKSPICIPFHIVREIGTPEEIYAPWDDVAYCYKVSRAGYANGVFAINFRSDVSWGTTRHKQQKYQVEKVQERNLFTFRTQYPDLEPLDLKKYNNVIYTIAEVSA